MSTGIHLATFLSILLTSTLESSKIKVQEELDPSRYSLYLKADSYKVFAFKLFFKFIAEEIYKRQKTIRNMRNFMLDLWFSWRR